eukprot:SAG31_NODE_135_length_23206_cov_25.707967_13_plen_73_part_00
MGYDSISSDIAADSIHRGIYIEDITFRFVYGTAVRILFHLICSEQFNAIYHIFKLLHLSAEAKWVLWLCTPT